jgi:hypothetical protein
MRAKFACFEAEAGISPVGDLRIGDGAFSRHHVAIGGLICCF